ncbi:ComEC/Rec2 family competence protein [Microbacterium halophytorum]|uniref:ComEC/Rec2 family competence protein n=1 Tax=Microbacterium halophytorum TaxID=2067568 RepID=UPI001319D1E2|nr:ComEC/Rec2 family competence protein [Microbacterium halophytorum]
MRPSGGAGRRARRVGALVDAAGRARRVLGIVGRELGGGRRGSAPRDFRLVPVAIAAWSAAAVAVAAPRAAWPVAAACAAAGAVLIALSALDRRREGARMRSPRRDAPRGGERADLPRNGPRGRADPSRPLLAGMRRRARKWRPLLAVAAIAAAGAACVAGLASPARAAVADAADAGRVEVLGTVTTKVELRGDRVVFTLRSELVDEAGGRALRAAVPVRVSAPAGAVEAGLDLGGRVRAAGGARIAEAGRGEAIVVYATDVTVERAPPHVLGLASRMRDAFAERAAGLPGRGGELLPGLSVGDTRLVSVELDEQMKASSLSHLTAVSGANCALVVGLAFGACAVLGLRRGIRIAVSLTALAAFVVLVTPEASVVRAATMAAIAMLALLLGRAGAGVAMLSLAVAGIVIADPWLALNFGFLLSVAATGALLLLAGPLARGLERRMPYPLALALAVPLAAQLACGPIIVLFAPQVPLYGVPANMLAALAAPIATVAGLAACLLAAVPGLGAVVAWVGWVPSAWIAETAHLAASLPRAGLAWWEGAAGFTALAVIGACIAVLVIVPPARGAAAPEARSGGKGRTDRHGGVRSGPSGAPDGPDLRAGALVRRTAGAVLAIAAGLGAGLSLAGGAVVGPLTAPRGWAVAACDVGQGDAVLVRSAGEVMLVDTGPEPEPLAACLSRLGIRRIDVLVLTHFDADHTGGAAAIAGRVAHVIHGPEDDRAEAVLRALGDPPRTEVVAGMTGVLGGADWSVLWPSAGAAFPAGNDSSVVIDIAGGGVPRTLLLGDTSEQSQEAMLRRVHLAAPYGIVKVAHHGSADQLARLYVEAAPAVALVTVGDNDYGHPRAETLALLRRAGAAIARTDASGLVLVSAEEGGLALWRER